MFDQKPIADLLHFVLVGAVEAALSMQSLRSLTIERYHSGHHEHLSPLLVVLLGVVRVQPAVDMAQMLDAGVSLLPLHCLQLVGLTTNYIVDVTHLNSNSAS